MTCKCGISISWGLYAAGNGALWAMIPTGQSCKQLSHVNTGRWALSRHLMLTAPWLRVDWLYSNYVVGRVGQTISETVQLGNLRCGRFFGVSSTIAVGVLVTIPAAQHTRPSPLGQTCSPVRFSTRARKWVNGWLSDWASEWIRLLHKKNVKLTQNTWSNVTVGLVTLELRFA